MSNTVAVPFYVKNYKEEVSLLGNNALALSGFTLDFTPMVFYPDPTAVLEVGINEIYASEDTTTTSTITGFSGEDVTDIYQFSLDAAAGIPLDYSRKRIVWYFGDGTYSTDLLGKHVYKKPGVYNVTCVFFDASGNTYENQYDVDVTIKDFFPDSTSITLPTSSYILTAGRIESPFDIVFNCSWQKVNQLSATGGTTYRLTSLSATNNFFKQNLDNNKYGHLYPYSVFYDTTESVEGTTFTPIQLIQCSNPTYIYCKQQTNGDVVVSSKDEIGSLLCGVSGVIPVWYRDSFPQTNSIIYVTQYDRSNGINVLPVAFNTSVIENESLSALAFSSNGITGEGSVSSTFNIDSIKYIGQKINFVVTVKDQDWYTVPLSSNFTVGNTDTDVYNISVFPVNQSGTPQHGAGTITTNFGPLQNVTSGFYRGYFTPTTTATNIRLSAIVGLSGVSNTKLTGRSNTFTVYPSTGQYVVSKVNEDFDWTGEMKELRYQEFLQNYPVVFDDFFGTIFGNLSSDPLSMGKVPYEKIVNFVSNKFDINTCDADSLFSMSYELDSNFSQFEKNNFSYPAKLKRLVDLLSINYSRLRGNKNTFNQNLDPKYNIDPETFGLNLGSKLNFNTATLLVSTGYVVAYERYSGKYKLCNTYITTVSTPLIQVSPPTYALSSYNITWNWGLNLGDVVSGADISKYYDFYSYIDYTDSTILNGTLDYSNPLNTLQFTNSSYSDWAKDGGIIEGLLSNALYTGINLLST